MMHTRAIDDASRRRAAWLLLALLGGLTLAPAAAQERTSPATLRIRPQATIVGRAPTLADVLVIEAQSLAEAIGEKPAAPGLRIPAHTELSHEQIARRLEELGVNLGDVLLIGASRCRVRIEAEEPPSPATPAPERAAPADGHAGAAPPEIQNSNPDAETLGDALRRFIQQDVARLGGEAEVAFERAGQEFLRLSGPEWEFQINAIRGVGALGLREFRVALRRDGRTQRMVTIGARVRLTRDAVVARRPLSVGNIVRRDDVEVVRRVFDSADDAGFAAAEEVVGQQVKRFVAAGQLCRRGDLTPLDLVQRSRPVTITGGGAGIEMRMAGLALDSGKLGQSVRVRVGDSRKDQRELRGVVTGVATVRLAEDG